VGGIREDRATGRIRVDAIGEEFGLAIEQGVHVNQGQFPIGGDGADERDDFAGENRLVVSGRMMLGDPWRRADPDLRLPGARV